MVIKKKEDRSNKTTLRILKSRILFVNELDSRGFKIFRMRNYWPKLVAMIYVFCVVKQTV